MSTDLMSGRSIFCYKQNLAKIVDVRCLVTMPIRNVLSIVTIIHCATHIARNNSRDSQFCHKS